MKRQVRPDPVLADHEETMKMLRASAGGDPAALKKFEEWGQRRMGRLPVLRAFARLLARHGMVSAGMDRADRDYAIAQCYAIATRHGLGMMGYVYNDAISGPLASLMSIDLRAVELDGSPGGDPGSLFASPADERAFLESVKGVGLDGLGRMARDAVIPERERLILA